MLFNVPICLNIQAIHRPQWKFPLDLLLKWIIPEFLEHVLVSLEMISKYSFGICDITWAFVKYLNGFSTSTLMPSSDRISFIK